MLHSAIYPQLGFPSFPDEPGPQQLPHGKEHRSEMYMLPTVNIDESSYGGNIQVIQYTLAYLGLSTGDRKIELDLEHLIPWIGDQATTQCCRGAQSFRAECRNGYDRLEPFRFIFGLFHCQMALSAGVFEASRGTSSGSTFARDVIHLSRRGMNTNMNKTRPNSHIVDEFLLHEGEAQRHLIAQQQHIETHLSQAKRAVTAWIEAHGAEDVLKLATSIYSKHASSGALYRLEHSNSTDDVQPTTIVQNRDLMLYYALRTAVQHGRIDWIEDLLWELLVFFSGSGNSNYAKEVYEFLQFITYECSPELKAEILKHSLLVNMAGRGDSFYPINQRQEHNNAGIRDYAPPAQHATWEQYEKISPVIPFYLNLVKHVEEQLHIHKDPKHEHDVLVLMRSHKGMEMHTDVPGRKIVTADKSKDSVAIGTKSLKTSKLKEWAQKAQAFYSSNSDKTMYEDLDIPQPDSDSRTPSGSPLFPSSDPATPGDLGQPGMTTCPETSSFELKLKQFNTDWNEWEWMWTETETGDFGMWSVLVDAPEVEVERDESETEEAENIGEM
ncbi:hypothetical protein BDV93DRAFT_561113 [Ceratobasidium sp. AG-I]|nr:hypothetical protein BDV93DRAFT_561113 [Ceratobasidium sp. AG-I]